MSEIFTVWWSIWSVTLGFDLTDRDFNHSCFLIVPELTGVFRFTRLTIPSA